MLREGWDLGGVRRIRIDVDRRGGLCLRSSAIPEPERHEGERSSDGWVGDGLELGEECRGDRERASPEAGEEISVEEAAHTRSVARADPSGSPERISPLARTSAVPYAQMVPPIPPRYCHVCGFLGHRPKSSASGGEAIAWIIALLLAPFGIGIALIVVLLLYGSNRRGSFDQCPRCKNRGTVAYVQPQTHLNNWPS